MEKSIWKDPTLNKWLHKLKFAPFFSRFLVILQSAAQFGLYSGVYNFEADHGPERRHQRMPECSAPDAEELGKTAAWSYWPHLELQTLSQTQPWKTLRVRWSTMTPLLTASEDQCVYDWQERICCALWTSYRILMWLFAMDFNWHFNLPWIFNWTGNNIQDWCVKLTFIVFPDVSYAQSSLFKSGENTSITYTN